MATERQIAANRRNAAKSTGPRSAAGKKRVGQNAVRHGLFSMATRVSALEEIEVLAHAMAGEDTRELALIHARSVAEADIEMNRARQVKLALIDRVENLGIDAPQLFPKSWKSLMEMDLYPPRPEEGRTSKPPEGLDRSFEAMRLALPDLERLTNYEKRAASRRDRAVRLLASLK